MFRVFCSIDPDSLESVDFFVCIFLLVLITGFVFCVNLLSTISNSGGEFTDESEIDPYYSSAIESGTRNC